MSLKVNKITFYNNGYTTFEKIGAFSGDTAIDVYFRKSDYEEVMKSLSITVAEGEGKIKSVSFQSEKQVEQLGDLTIKINNDYSLTSVLKSIPGSRIAVHTTDGRVEGRLIGIEVVHDSGKKDHVINLYADGKIQSFILSQLRNIELLEKTLQDEFQHVLEVYNSQKKKDLLKLTIFASGKNYTVRMIYSVQVPIWKTCYRLYLNEKNREKCVLKIFAVIENTQEEDWKNVELAFVTGAPNIAPTGGSASVSSGGSMRVVVKKGGSTYRVACNSSDLVEVFKSKLSRQCGSQASGLRLIFQGKPIEDGRTLREYNIRTGSTVHCTVRSSSRVAVESGGPVFRLCHPQTLTKIDIKNVNVKRNQSAFIEILSTDVAPQLVTLYNQSYRKGNPLCAMIFENSTGYSLLSGTLLIKSPKDGSTIGETNVEPMWPHDIELYPFAIEFGVEVKVTDNFSKLKIHRSVIKNGAMSNFRYTKLRTMYQLENRTERSFPKFYLDHFYKEGWKLLNEEPAIDVTDKFYRFEMSVAKNEKKKYDVVEQSVDKKVVYLSSMAKSEIDNFFKLGIIDKRVKKDLEKILEMRSDIAAREKAIYRIDEQMRTCRSVQQRARQNLEVLKDETLRKKYAAILSEEEDKLAKFEKERKEVNAEKQVLNTQKLQHTQSITFEYIHPEEIKKKE